MVKTTEALALVHEIKALLSEKKAEDVVALDLRGVSDTLDYFVIATAQSTPHLRALEHHLEERLETLSLRPRSTEESPRWVVLDLGEVVVHLMSREARAFYDLEGFWADAERV
ncbi:MAG: ribosome silencing factor [Thermaceae bacterium]